MEIDRGLCAAAIEMTMMANLTRGAGQPAIRLAVKTARGCSPQLGNFQALGIRVRARAIVMCGEIADRAIADNPGAIFYPPTRR